MPTASTRLITLGAVRVSSASGEELQSVTAQPRRVALLSYLMLARPRGFHTRDQLLSLFWPEYDNQRARNALSQAVHFLRRSLGAEVILSGAEDRLRINPDLCWCDAIAFEAALSESRVHEAIELYGGPFFEGFHVSAAAPELDRWVDSERDRLGRQYGDALRQMANARSTAGDFSGAVAWHRKLAAHDPLSSRTALGLMQALVAAGEAESALQHARVFETLVRQELDSAPDAQFEEYVRSLRKRTAPAVPNDDPHRDAPARPSRAVVAGGVPTAGATSMEPVAGAARRQTRYVSLAVGLLTASLALAAIAASRRGRSVPRLQCVAVLPIQNLSRDSTLDSFAESMTVAMITELMRFPDPRVIPPASMAKLEGTRQSLPEIGKVLDCDGVVDASLTRNGPAVHVDVRLLYAPEDRHLWARPFENDTSRSLVLQRAVIEAVVQRVQSFVGRDASVTAQPSRRVDTLAYKLYLHGRDEFRSRSAPSLNLAVAAFKQAIDQDSTFAAAYAGVADAYGYMATQGFAKQSYLDSARLIAARALALDDKSSEAHTSMGWILASDRNWSRAEDEFNQALRLQPDNALAHHWYALLLVTLDRREEALAQIRLAKQLDPTSQVINGANMMIEFFNGVKLPLGNPGNVKTIADRTFPLWHSVHGVNLARRGRCGEAYDANRIAQELAPDNTLMMLGLVGVHLLCGDSARGHALMKEVERRPDAAHMAVYIATIYAYEHKPDIAFAWLDRAQWNLQTYYQLRVNSDLAPLRADPRFTQLLRRLKMP